jgi:uncharacterized protein YjbI with pentapeptide repeats
MANEEHVAKLKEGVTAWNAWREKNPAIRPDLRQANLIEANLRGANLRMANFSEANLSGANLSGADLIFANFVEANLIKANLSGANLYRAELVQANLSGARLDKAVLMEAHIEGATLSEAHLESAELVMAILTWTNLSGADLSKANLRQSVLNGANLSKAKLSGAALEGAILLTTDFSDADLTGCRVWGASAWGLKLDGAKQQDLIITHVDEPEITVDNIEVAQFIYLLLHNQKIRDVIDTITSKAVLILGRFTDERKAVLDALREELRNRNLLPILFDFAIPASRDVTETIKTLASLARFVIADVTDATEVRVELHNIVPDFTSLPIQLILLRGHAEFVSLSHLTKFPWVLPIFEYRDREHLSESLDKSIISPAEDLARKLRS